MLPGSTQSAGFIYTDYATTADIGDFPDVINPAKDKFYADGYSVVEPPIDDVIGRVGETVGAGTGAISVPIPGAVVDGQLGDVVGSMDDLRDMTQTQILDKTITVPDNPDKPGEDEKPKPIDPPKVGLPTLPEVLFTQKFPFCIPWDLYNSVASLAAPPKPPNFTIPFLKVDRLGWDFDITLDLTEFEPLAKISRWGFSVLFLLGLMYGTRKLIWK